MPQNKNFQRRITILDECFANRTGFFTLEKLVEVIKDRLGETVSIRTLQNDIRYIREMIEENNSQTIDFLENPVFVPRLFDGKKTVFKYSDVNLALGNQLLSKSDREQLEDTLAILSRYRNREDFYWLDELFPRIESAFKLVHEDYSGLISYQNNRDYEGQSWVGALYNQLIRKKVILVEYQSFTSESAFRRKIHPWHLKQYNDRWFLFGLEEFKDQNDMLGTRITTLALDRIKGITETAENSRENEIYWGDYFDEIIGVSKMDNGLPIEIKMKFSKKRLPYVLTKPIHGATQRIDKSDVSGQTIIIEVIPNFELFQTLLSFGDDLEVVSPQNIREELQRITENMLRYYKLTDTK